MSIFPKYQPIQFETYLPNECRAELYDFQSITEQGDYATFQVIVVPCEGVENVVQDPNFQVVELGPWTPSGGFSLITGDACKDNDDSIGSVTQVDVFVPGQAYQAIIDVTSLTGSLQIYNGATLIYTVYNQGTSTFSFVATDPDIILSFDNGDDYGCINSFTALPFSENMAFGIIDSNGDTAFVADFANNPEYFTFVENTVTIRFLWSDIGLTDGCYRIGFADGCTNTNAQFGIFNSNFLNGDLGWSEDEGTLDSIDFIVAAEDTMVEFVGPIMSINEVGSITSTATQATVGMCYTITMEGFVGDGFFRVYFGTAFVDFTNPEAIETHNITCTGNGTITIEAHLGTNDSLGLFYINVSLCDPTDYAFDYMSQSFKLADDHPCTHLISLTCDDNALNYVFVGSGFEPNVRLISEIYNSAPEELRESYHDNVGTKKVTYGEYRKHFFFVIEMIPAWLLDFFYLGRIADNWYIDGTAYFMEGDTPNPEWADGITNFATLRTEISEKTQLTRNANINVNECVVSQEINCAEIAALTNDQAQELYDCLTANFLFWFNTENCVITTTTLLNDTITTNGGTDDVWTERNPWSQSLGNVFDVSAYLTENFQIFGMSEVGENGDSYVGIHYAIYRNSATQLFIFEENSSVYSDAGADNTKLFRIVSDGVDVKYYLDGALIYTSANPPVGDYKIKLSFFNDVNTTGIIITDF